MGFLDGGKSDQIKYLDEERKKIWDRLVKLESYAKTIENEVNRRTPQAEKEAKEHSKKASEYRNRAQQKMDEAVELVAELKKQLQQLVAIKENSEITANVITQIKNQVNEIKNDIDSAKTILNGHVDSVESRIALIDDVYEKYPNIDEELAKLDSTIAKIDENLKKSNLTLSSINTRKTEVDDIHREIFGYVDSDEVGEEVVIEGLKGNLEKAYEKITEEIEQAQKMIDSVKDEYVKNFKQFEQNHVHRYETIQNEIRKLLPNALTAGLSSAFSKKKEEEEQASIKLQKRFTLGIYMLLVISLLPVSVSIFFLIQDISLEAVILRLPRLVLAIVPMYIPALWIAYSASKKLNLSKRLIEEYAHKEVLSRTYEGLSNQISNINDIEKSEELRIKLLANFLQITSENPGKLISDYETSDHPIMEALEQSYKLQLAFEKLDGIPGLGKIAAVLEKSAKKKLEDKTEKIEQALNDPNFS